MCENAPGGQQLRVISSRLDRFQEAKALLLKLTPVARRALGESDVITFKIRGCYAEALYRDEGATLDELREAVTTLEDTERTARRVMGGAHPLVEEMEISLRDARAALSAQEASARADRLERELVEARRQVAELRRTKPSSDDAAELTEAEVRGALQAAGGRMKTKDLLVRFKARLKANPANKDAIKRILRAVADVSEESGVRMLVLKTE